MPTSRTLLAVLLGSLLAMGCTAAPAEGAATSQDALEEAHARAGLEEGTLEAEGILLLVNDRQLADVSVLAGRAGLSEELASAIVAYRIDADGKPRWFKTLAEIDALPGTTAETFTKLLADARTNGYVDEGELQPPTLAQIVLPDGLFVTPSFETVRVDAGFDGLPPYQAIEIVRSRVPNNIHVSNEQFLRRTIETTHKSFTLGVGNLFVENAPFASWLRGLHADKITLLGTMSAIHPIVLLTEKDGVKSYWLREGSGYVPMDWGYYRYPVIMRAHVRLETDPAGQGVRIHYPACPLKVLEQSTHVVIESPE